MNKIIFTILFFVLPCVSAQNVHPNIQTKISIDKTVYVYGEAVHISIKVINTSSTQDTLFLSNCAPYPYIDDNDYFSIFSLGCFPDSVGSTYIIPGKDSIEWKFDYPHQSMPQKMLIVGQHTTFGYFGDHLANADTVSFYIKEATNEVQIKTIGSKFILEQNYPNPFNPSTTISFQLERKSFVSLKIYDLLGREVASLIQSEMLSGYHNIEWTPKRVSSGVYYCRIVTENHSDTRKLIFNK